MKKIITLLFISAIGYGQTIQHISNGETGLSTRNKLNSVIDTVNLLRTVATGTSAPTLQKVINQSPTVSGVVAQSPDGNTKFTVNNNSALMFTDNGGAGGTVQTTNTGVSAYFSSGTYGGGFSSNATQSEIYHDLKNNFNAPNNNFPNETASKLAYFDASKNLKPVTLGSGLTLTTGTLSATSSGSTTILTASTNITVSGTAPNYTISAASPTITAGSNMSVTTSGLNYTVAANAYQSQTGGFTAVSNPADGTTVFFGYSWHVGPSLTNGGLRRMYAGVACTITAVTVNSYNASGNASAETYSVYVRVNNTTDYTISTAGLLTTPNTFVTNQSMSVPLGATDYYEYKVVYPTFATNPLGTYFFANAQLKQ